MPAHVHGFVSRGFLLASLLAIAACGGKKKPITPDETASNDGGTDMPSTDDAGMPDMMASSDGGSSTPMPEKKAPPALALPAASAKITIKKKPVEVKSDGSVSIGGKPVGKLSGADMQDADGKTALSVSADGAVTTGDGTNVGSFTGDDLMLTTGDKYVLADDGNLSVTASGGKAASWGKATGRWRGEARGAPRGVHRGEARCDDGEARPAGRRPRRRRSPDRFGLESNASVPRGSRRFRFVSRELVDVVEPYDRAGRAHDDARLDDGKRRIEAREEPGRSRARGERSGHSEEQPGTTWKLDVQTITDALHSLTSYSGFSQKRSGPHSHCFKNGSMQHFASLMLVIPVCFSSALHRPVTNELPVTYSHVNGMQSQEVPEAGQPRPSQQ